MIKISNFASIRSMKGVERTLWNSLSEILSFVFGANSQQKTYLDNFGVEKAKLQFLVTNLHVWVTLEFHKNLF